MADITIPGWAIWVYGAFGTVWLSWMIILTKMAFDTKSDMRLANASDVVILAKINEVEKKIDDNKNDTNRKLDRLDVQMDKIFDHIRAATK